MFLPLAVALILRLAPGYHEKPDPERPRFLGPLRHARRGPGPANPALLKAYRGSLDVTIVIVALVGLGTQYKPLANVMSPVGLMVECAVIALFLGRAWGLWSADRKLRKIETAEVQAAIEA